MSTNWGAWLEVGMAAEVTAPTAFRDLQRGTRQEPLDHPLLEVARATDGGGRIVCSGTLAADTHWVLDEHRIAGVPVLPGTGHLELVWAAFARAQRSSLTEVHLGDGEELALLVPGDLVTGDLAHYGLHPALLDGATASGQFGAADGRYLPLGYGRLVVHRPMSDPVYSHLRHRSTATAELLTCDITLFDEQGRVLAEIGDFMLRRIDADEVSANVTASRAPERSTADDVAPASGSGDRDGDRHAVGIRPRDGAEAFIRLLGARVGPQAAVTALHLPTLMAKVARVTRARVTAELVGRGATGQTGAAVLSGDYVAPRTLTEERLVAPWEEATGVVGIGVEYSFFGIGGNSLVATQLLARVRGTFGVKLPMRVLCQSPTIASMAAAVDTGVDALA